MQIYEHIINLDVLRAFVGVVIRFFLRVALEMTMCGKMAFVLSVVLAQSSLSVKYKNSSSSRDCDMCPVKFVAICLIDFYI